jgi:phosphoribosyl 1,2-cyclic phosphodiesterase
MTINVKFWGVRGSIACPGPGTVRYGGNTPCLEVRCGGQTVIFDGGTGLRPFGDTVLKSGTVLDADLFLSHCHLDHVAGLPFFSPLFAPKHRLRIWAGNLPSDLPLKTALRTMMSPPLFPIDVESFRADIEYRDFRPGTGIALREGITLKSAMLNHPGGAVGYRLEYGGKVLAYITDTELPAGRIDPQQLALAHNADLLVFDCTYTESEIASHRGWGHSTWQDGIRFANEAGARQLCLFHHDPSHDDGMMETIERQAAAARPGTIAAKEGLAIEL